MRPFDCLFHRNDRGALGVFDLLADTAIFHTPRHSLTFLKVGKVLGFADTQFLKGHGGVLDFLFDALVIEDRWLFQKSFLGVLRRFLFKGRSDGIFCGCAHLRLLGCRLFRRRGSGRFGCRCRRRFRLLGCWSGYCGRIRCRHRFSRLRRRLLRLGCRIRCCSLHRRCKGIALICPCAVFENRLNVQTFLAGDLAKRPCAVAGFTHKCLLLSILGQKKAATAPMSNYGFFLSLFHSSSSESLTEGAMTPFPSPFLPNLLRPDLLRPEIQFYSTTPYFTCIVGGFP